jgi:hypothetical protein
MTRKMSCNGDAGRDDATAERRPRTPSRHHGGQDKGCLIPGGNPRGQLSFHLPLVRWLVVASTPPPLILLNPPAHHPSGCHPSRCHPSRCHPSRCHLCRRPPSQCCHRPSSVQIALLVPPSLPSPPLSTPRPLPDMI